MLLSFSDSTLCPVRGNPLEVGSAPRGDRMSCVSVQTTNGCFSYQTLVKGWHPRFSRGGFCSAYSALLPMLKPLVKYGRSLEPSKSFLLA